MLSCVTNLPKIFWEEENDVAAGCRLTFCLSVQLDTIKLKVPAANKPAVQKADNGG